MGYDLNSLSQVITATFLLDNMLIYLAGCNVAFASKSDIEVALVVSEVEVDFTAIIEDKDFAMPSKGVRL